MKLEESNYLTSFLPLTVISDTMNLAENVQIGDLIQSQSFTRKKRTKESVLVQLMSPVKMNLK